MSQARGKKNSLASLKLFLFTTSCLLSTSQNCRCMVSRCNGSCLCFGKWLMIDSHQLRCRIVLKEASMRAGTCSSPWLWASLFSVVTQEFPIIHLSVLSCLNVVLFLPLYVCWEGIQQGKVLCKPNDPSLYFFGLQTLIQGMCVWTHSQRFSKELILSGTFWLCEAVSLHITANVVFGSISWLEKHDGAQTAKKLGL